MVIVQSQSSVAELFFAHTILAIRLRTVKPSSRGCSGLRPRASHCARYAIDVG